MTLHSERRRYPRYKIELAGRIGAEGHDSHACQVRDYCSGGMLIALRDGGSAQAVFVTGQAIALSIQLATNGGRRAVTIPATVRWLQDNYLGIAFAKPSAVIVDALQEHDRLAGAAPPHDRQPNPQGEGRCLAKMRHVAQGTLPAILRELLAATLDDLLDGVDRVSSDADRQQVFGDLAALEDLAKRDLLIREVMAKALNPVQDAAVDRPDAGADGEMSLVDNDEFERWLEASRAATHLEGHFAEQLAIIGARLASLRSQDAADRLVVPFEPKHFTDALKAVAEQLELGAVTRRFLFGRCVRVLDDRLGPFYAELDGVLDAAGVAKLSTHPAVHDAQQRQAAAASAPSSLAETVPAGSADAGDATVQADANLVTVDARALEALVARDRRVREDQARDLLRNLALGSDNSQAMGEWLQMIDAPVVAEAVADPAFFQGHDNPLHTIVDALGHLQLFRPTPESGIDDDALRQQVNALLAPLQDGDADARLLGRVADDIATLTREQSDHYQRNVERVVEASEGRDRVRRAREAVIRELDRRYAGRRVPAVVPELIDVGWRSVLELAWLNSSVQPAAYAQQFALLDSVIAHLDGDAVDERPVVADRAELLTRIGAELETAAFDPFRRTAVEGRLRDQLVGGADVELVAMAALGDDLDSSGAAQRPAQIPEAAWTQALATCAGLRLGDRVRFVDASDGDRVLRVAWIRGDRELFTLVDHRGIRVRDIALLDLAIGIHQRDIRLDPVDGTPLSDRAVGQMLEAMEARLSHLASHDSLTGLMNRRQFHAALDKAVQTGGDAPAGALLWVDIDQFKLINDLHGYATGDRLLVAVSALLQRLGDGMTLAHLGADRFAVLAAGATADAATRWAEDLTSAARRMPFDWDSRSMALTISVGVAMLGAAADGPGDAIQAAEQALAVAKAGGGDQVHLYRDDDPEIVRQRDSVKWVARVDEALVDGELRLRCQPIVPVRPGEGVAPHYEVLLGVADGSREALPIAEFIEAAERYKRMRAVDRWVTKSVFDWISAHREQMPQLHGFAVNLSGQTASDPAFVDFVRQQFARTAIDPDWISFEVTETAAVASLSGTAGIIQELKRLGCKVALDDFGSGLASYSYLKELPVDWLKIDGVFVRDIATDREDYAVVKSINDIGHFLGKKTIAEYVKDQPTLDLVREIGVDLAQGFGISPPLLMDELLPSLARQAAS
ncbi:MAG: DUF1631 family protein [Gammaproteobacteria bacterium]|nr:DUF1631 family protein [Gammaproteobacteria bacterium]